MRADGRHTSRTFEIQGRGVYLVALALTLLYTAACGVRAGVPTASTRATATTTPAPHLAFRPVALPPGFDSHLGSVAVSPVDGKDAWVCLRSGNESFQIWATTDEGSTWHAAGLLHPTTPQPAYRCSILPDQGNAQAAVFSVVWGSVQTCDEAQISFYTRDGGQHWQQLPGWTFMRSVYSNSTTSYAQITIITPSAGQPQPALLQSVSPPRLSAPGPCPTPQQPVQVRSGFMVSSDGMQTWRELHPGGLTPTDPMSQFWHSPTNGEMFVATYTGVLLHSLDDGANWTHVNAPIMQISLGRWLASQQAWMFCGEQGPPPATLCSTDTGTTWRQVPIMKFTVHIQCDDWCHKKGGQDSQTSLCPPFALGSDGSLVAACPLDSASAASGQTMSYRYRFASGASAWAALGAVPAEACQVAANDIMWCTNVPDAVWETTTLPA